MKTIKIPDKMNHMRKVKQYIEKKIPETLKECQSEIQCRDCVYYNDGHPCRHVDVLKAMEAMEG